MRHLCWLMTSTALAFSGLPAQALAQATPQDSPTTLDEIVVTAQKRETSLIETPQSVTALSSQDLARLNATQLRDIADRIPALTMTTSGVGQSQITLRGVTAGVDIGPTVGIYVDETPYGSSSAFTNGASLGLDAGLFDLDRVEVLRGPQGTLYGASAMGGVLRYITPKPDLSGFSGLARAGVSSTHEGGTNYDAALAVNLPLVSEALAVRASGFLSEDGGFISDIARGEDHRGRSRVEGGRLDLLARPGDRLSIRLTGFTQTIDREGVAAADYALSGGPIDGAFDQRRVMAEPFDQEFSLISGMIDYDLGAATLTSVTSYQIVDTRYRLDASGVYVPLLGSLGLPFSATPIDQRRSTDKFTQEVRLTSAGAGRLEWLVGGFYTHEDSQNRQQIVAYDLDGSRSAVDLATSALPSRYEEAAIFGNVTLRLTDALDVTGGLRYAHNSQTFEQIATGLLIGSAPAASASDDVVTYLVNARYRFSPDATLYGRFATGYRPGGPNFVARDPVTGDLLAPASFEADTLTSYEIGYKARTADRRFGIDAAIYHIDWEDIQAATAAGGLSVLVNGGQARIDGAEVSLSADPVEWLTLSGAFAWQDARLDQDAPLLGAVRGDRLPNVPRYTVSLGAEYRLVGHRLQPSLGAAVRYVSDRSASFDANPGLPQYHLPSYVSLDLNAGLALGAVDARLFVRNLTDERGQLSASTALSVLGGPAQVSLLQPRTVGVSLSTRF